MLAFGPLATLPLASGPLGGLNSAAAFLTNVAATGTLGTITVTGVGNVLLTEVHATGTLSSIVVGIDDNAFLSGVATTLAQGDLVVTGKASVTVTEVHATTALGSVTASISVTAALTGLLATGVIGTITDVTGSANIFPLGVSTQGALGSILIWNPINPDVPGNWVPVPAGPGGGWTPVVT